MAVGANNVIIDKYCQKLPHLNISFLDPFLIKKAIISHLEKPKGSVKGRYRELSLL